ncbi:MULTISPECIES: hypothetical protein [unclassified Cytobacillus]|uniref:hypothetical protein n=1 Tax=unclassified Cytobacillus TaxID=2675268 RepID=UPI0020424452|nr:hypothetical protein [Cytobacillus sp. AMY 15.2]MCM3090713.1 hypothetical protein [Cytobacillus sp. AMY 15.2]
MQKKINILLCSAGISIMLGGCSGMNLNNNQQNEQAKETQAAPTDDSLISVQDFTVKVMHFPMEK